MKTFWCIKLHIVFRILTGLCCVAICIFGIFFVQTNYIPFTKTSFIHTESDLIVQRSDFEIGQLFTKPSFIYTQSDLTIQPTDKNDFEIGQEIFNKSNEKVYKDCFKPKKEGQNEWNFGWKIKPLPCNKDLTTVILLIKSSIFRNSLRKVLRQTWARNITDPKVGHIQRIFIVGSAVDKKTVVLLEKESQIENDILQGTFLDTFRSVSHKVVLGMRFIKQYCPNVQMILVADDDALIFPWNLFSHLNFDYKSDTNVMKNFYFGGFVWRNAEVIRDRKSKYYVSYKQYNCITYPPFLSGALYVMSYSAMVQLYYLTQTVEYIFTDDVTFSVVAKLGNVSLTAFPQNKLSMYPHMFLQSPQILKVSNLIVFHGVDYAADQIKIWSEVCYQETSNIDISRLNLLYCSPMLNK